MIRIADIFYRIRWACLLAAVNIVIYLASASSSANGIEPHFILTGNIVHTLLHPWLVVSYIFMHLSPLHIAFNTAALIFLAAWYLRRGSLLGLLLIYLAGGIAGGLVFSCVCYVGASSEMCLAGASSSICAVASASAILNNGIRIKFDSYSFNISPFILISTITIIAATGILSTNSAGTMAHIGGIASGVLISYLKMRQNRKTKNPLIQKAELSGFASLSQSERSRLAGIK